MLKSGRRYRIRHRAPPSAHREVVIRRLRCRVSAPIRLVRCVDRRQLDPARTSPEGVDCPSSEVPRVVEPRSLIPPLHLQSAEGNVLKSAGRMTRSPRRRDRVLVPTSSHRPAPAQATLGRGAETAGCVANTGQTWARFQPDGTDPSDLPIPAQSDPHGFAKTVTHAPSAKVLSPADEGAPFPPVPNLLI